MRCHANAHGADEINIENLGKDVQTEFLVAADNARGVHNNMQLRKATDECVDRLSIGNVKNLGSNWLGQHLVGCQTDADHARSGERKRLGDCTADAASASCDKHMLPLEVKHELHYARSRVRKIAGFLAVWVT